MKDYTSNFTLAMLGVMDNYINYINSSRENNPLNEQFYANYIISDINPLAYRDPKNQSNFYKILWGSSSYQAL